MIKNKSLKRKIAIITSLVLVLAIIISAAVVLFSNPYGKFGYLTLFRDNASKTYSSGRDFDYGPFKFNVTVEQIEIKPALLTCDGDFYLSGRLIMSNDECMKLNDQTRTKTAKNVDIKVRYTVKNTTNEVQRLSGDWLKVYGSDGQKFLSSEGTSEIPSNITIVKELSAQRVRETVTETSTILKLPEGSSQSVTKKN